MGNNYNNSQNEINNLKSELSKANKIINEQKLKIQELQTQLNTYKINYYQIIIVIIILI